MDIKFALLIILIAFASYLAYKNSLLSLSGAFAAFFVGSSVFVGFGLNGLLLMGIFFVSSSLLSKYKKKQKSSLDDLHEKESIRDWAQVAANGGIAAITGLVAYFYSDSSLLFAFALSLAGANADTWASELGSLSKSPPFSIKGFTRVSAGTSGAISLLGTFAGFLGSLLIAFSTMILFHLDLLQFVLILVFGFVAMLIDTLFGAYLQAEYQCTNCHRLVEKPYHCGIKTGIVKGVNWIRNDEVNFLSNLFAVFLGLFFFYFMT